MTKLNLKAFRDLVSRTRSKTFFANAHKDSLITAARSWVEILDRHNVDDHVIDLHAVKESDGFTSDELSLDKEEKAEKNSTVVSNWLIKLVSTLWVKVAEQAEMIKFNFTRAEAKEEEVAKLKVEVEELRKYCDEVQQRSMKGNIIISSPNLGNGNKASLMKQQRVGEGATSRLETVTEMCCRLILKKTGVTVPDADISACHVLGRHGADSTYIMRIHNRKPNSAWEVLSAGMLTGKNNETRNYFDKDVNVFLNFQLTAARAKLLEEVKKERKSKRITSYGVDQNGRVTVRVGKKEETGWAQVTSATHLQTVIAKPPQPTRRRQHS